MKVYEMSNTYIMLKIYRGEWYGLFDGQIDETIEQFLEENEEHLIENDKRFNKNKEKTDDYINHLIQMAKYGTNERKQNAINKLQKLKINYY